MDIKQILKENDFQFKHKFGQNFITDTNLLKAIVGDSDIKSDDCVLEIGAGAGTLTKEICKKTQAKVISVEIDKKLKPILEQNLASFKNLELIFDDILKLSPQKLKDLFDNKPFKVVANLPYYISTPIIFYLLENSFNLKSITVMLQLEVAKRLTAPVGTKDYGALTILLQFLGEVSLTRKVPRTLFVPQPNVDSAIVRLDLIKKDFGITYLEFAPFIKACFSMRRKTLENNIISSFPISRDEFKSACLKLNIKDNVRAENLDIFQFVSLFKELFKK